jgi:Amt family ammonium transporter
VVHMLSAATVLAGHVFLTYKQAPNYAVKIPNNAGAAFRSVLLLWMLSTAVYAGKAHDASPVAAQAVVNTIAAVHIALLVGYLLDRVYNVKVANSPISMLSHILLALVGSASGCGYTTVGGAMFTSIVVVLVTKLIARYALSDGIVPHDPLNVTTIHGIGGTVGFIMTGITSYAFINPDGRNGLTYGAVGLIRVQVAAALALWACAFAAVLVLLYLCDLIVPLSAYTDGKRVLAPSFVHITPPPPAPVAKPEAIHDEPTEAADLTEQEKFEMQREASLYRKLSRYFSSQRGDSFMR